MQLNSFFIIQIVVSGYLLWMGLFLISQSILNREITDSDNRFGYLGGATIAFTSLFGVGIAFQEVSVSVADYLLWFRFTWWTSPVSVGFWVLAILLIHPKNKPAPELYAFFTPVVKALIVVYALAMGILGITTNLIFDLNHDPTQTIVPGTFSLDPNFPTMFLSEGFIWGGMILIVYLIFLNWRLADSKEEKNNFSRMLIAHVIATLGIVIFTTGYFILDTTVTLFSDVLSGIGLLLTTRALLFYHSSINNQVLQSEFRKTAVITIVMIGVFVTAVYLPTSLTGIQLPLFLFPIVFFLAIIISVFFPVLGLWVDQWLLQHWESALTTQISRVSRQIRLAPNQGEALNVAKVQLSQITVQAQSEQLLEMIEQEIQAIFRHKSLQNVDRLNESPLFDLQIVQNGIAVYADTQPGITRQTLSRKQKAEALRGFLSQLIKEELSNNHHNSSVNSDEPDQQIPFFILFFAYIENETRQEITQRIESAFGIKIVSNSRAYTEFLQQGRLSLAHKLWEKELNSQPV